MNSIKSPSASIHRQGVFARFRHTLGLAVQRRRPLLTLVSLLGAWSLCLFGLAAPEADDFPREDERQATAASNYDPPAPTEEAFTEISSVREALQGAGFGLQSEFASSASQQDFQNSLRQVSQHPSITPPSDAESKSDAPRQGLQSELREAEWKLQVLAHRFELMNAYEWSDRIRNLADEMRSAARAGQEAPAEGSSLASAAERVQSSKKQ